MRLKPGDVVGWGSGINNALLGAIEVSTQGGASHVAIYLEDDNGQGIMAEATAGIGVHVQQCEKCVGEYCMIARPQEPLTRKQQRKMIEETLLRWYKNRKTGEYKYNHALVRDPQEKHMYCSEFVEYIYKKAEVEIQAKLLSPATLKRNMDKYGPGLEEMLWGNYGLFFMFNPKIHNMDKQELISPADLLTAKNMELIQNVPSLEETWEMDNLLSIPSMGPLRASPLKEQFPWETP